MHNVGLELTIQESRALPSPTPHVPVAEEIQPYVHVLGNKYLSGEKIQQSYSLYVLSKVTLHSLGHWGGQRAS